MHFVLSPLRSFQIIPNNQVMKEAPYSCTHHINSFHDVFMRHSMIGKMNVKYYESLVCNKVIGKDRIK